MKKQSVHHVSGIVSAVALVALTACGGSSSTSGTSSADLIVAPALDSGTVTETVAATTPAPAAPTIAEQIPATPSVQEIVATESPVAESIAADTAIIDQMLISGASGIGCDADAAAFNTTMLALINASRSEARMCGSNPRAPVPTVRWNDKLALAAVAHGNDMAVNNFFDHTGSDGLGVGDRATTATYNWRAVGENIAAGQLEQAEVHQGWLDSEGHCINIMNKLFSEVGAACITNSGTDFGTYWVVVFGDAK